MALDVGLNVIEVDGRSSPTVQGAPTSVAAFIGRTMRGVPDMPVRVTTPGQFAARFGGALTEGYLAYAVNAFFQNGGREAYVSRVVGAGSAPGSARLDDRQTNAKPALRLGAGYRGRPDPGKWSDGIRLDVRDDPRASTKLDGDAAATATSAVLASLSGVSIGSVLRLASGASVVFRKVTSVEPSTRTVGWADALGVALPAAASQVTSTEFRILVRFQASPTEGFPVVEDWRRLSMETDSPDYVVTRLNHPFSGSTYLTATDLSGATGLGLDTPKVTSNVPLAGSTAVAPAASDYAGDAKAKTGLYALDNAQVQLLAVPDAHALGAGAQAVVRSVLDYCALRGDCMYVGSAPDRGSVGGAPARALSDYVQLESDYVTSVKAYSAGLQGTKVYGALYAPWVMVADPAGVGPAPTRFVPPDGHIMGVYARTEQERGIHKAPAGDAAQLRGVLGTSATFTDSQHTDLVRNGSVNGVRRLPGRGAIVAASRTLSTDSRWLYVNVRLTFNFVKASLRDGLRFVRQEPHTEELRRSVRLGVVTPFLLGLWRTGAFGSDPPEQVFTVKCDAENNPPDQVDLGNFRIEVNFYVARPAETIRVIVGQQPSGASATEA